MPQGIRYTDEASLKLAIVPPRLLARPALARWENLAQLIRAWLGRVLGDPLRDDAARDRQSLQLVLLIRLALVRYDSLARLICVRLYCVSGDSLRDDAVQDQRSLCLVLLISVFRPGPDWAIGTHRMFGSFGPIPLLNKKPKKIGRTG